MSKVYKPKEVASQWGPLDFVFIVHDVEIQNVILMAVCHRGGPEAFQTHSVWCSGRLSMAQEPMDTSVFFHLQLVIC